MVRGRRVLISDPSWISRSSGAAAGGRARDRRHGGIVDRGPRSGTSPASALAYLGLQPRVRQSGEQPASHGRITKAGSRRPAACWSRRPGRHRRRCSRGAGSTPCWAPRLLRRTIQREIEDQLSEKILFGEVEGGQIVVVDLVEPSPASGTIRAAAPARPESPRPVPRNAASRLVLAPDFQASSSFCMWIPDRAAIFAVLLHDHQREEIGSRVARRSEWTGGRRPNAM